MKKWYNGVLFVNPEYARGFGGKKKKKKIIIIIKSHRLTLSSSITTFAYLLDHAEIC